jgi:hypothetical protein
MDMEQIFSAGEIKTNFVISAPLQIPVSDNGWMVIQDKFSIPAGFTFEEAPGVPPDPITFTPGAFAAKPSITFDSPDLRKSSPPT